MWMYRVLHWLLGLTLCAAVLGWWELWPTLFYGSLGMSVIIMTCIDAIFTYGTGANFHRAIHAMPKTKCCAHELLSDPKHVQWTTRALRIVAGLCATASLFVSWSRRHAFVDKRVWFVSAAWCVTAIAWIVSCIPVFLCLIQCAANDASAEPNPYVLRFRRVSALWLLHDIVLGSFWVYLSFMLYDLTDDQDDSEWRTIFLSMLSWHIIVVVIHQCYCPPGGLQKAHNLQRSKPCCTPEAANRIWSWVRILCFIGSYAIIIMRIQQGDLIFMGFDETLHVVLLFVLILVACSSNTSNEQPHTPTRSTASDTNKSVSTLLF